jgi:hypothetical protein
MLSDVTTAPTPTLPLPLDAACMECGYSLRALTLPRCPECGRRFDPLDVFTYRTAGAAKVFQRLRWATAAVGLLVTVLGYRKWTDDEMFPGSAFIAAAACGAAVASLLLSWVGTPMPKGQKRFHRRLRFWCTLVAAALVFVTVQFWSCVHGEAVRIGPVAITHSVPEGMCRNWCCIGQRHRIVGDYSWYWVGGW